MNASKKKKNSYFCVLLFFLNCACWDCLEEAGKVDEEEKQTRKHHKEKETETRKKL